MIVAKSPSRLPTSTLAFKFPASISFAVIVKLEIKVFRFSLTFSIVLFINTFLPGRVSSGASKFPLPNSVITLIASFLTFI